MNMSRRGVITSVLVLGLVAASTTAVLRQFVNADTVSAVVSNKAQVMYKDSTGTQTITSAPVELTINSHVEPLPNSSTVLTAIEGKRSSSQRFQVSAQTTKKASVAFVYDYYSQNKTLPTAESKPAATRRLSLGSRNGGMVHSIDQSGNAGTNIVGYFEVKDGNTVIYRSDYYLIPATVGASMVPLP